MFKQHSEWCDWLILSLLNFTVAVVPLFFLVKNEEIFEFNKMLLTYGIVSLILTIWGTKTIFDKKLTLQKTPFDRWIILFFLSQLISTALSIHPQTSIYGYYTRFHGGLLSTICYIVIFYAAATFIQKKHFKTVIAFVLTGAFIAAMYAFPEHFGHSPSCLILNPWEQTVVTENGQSITKSLPLSEVFNASCWIQDVQSRVFGTFGQPNWLAAYLILLTPLAYALTLQRKLAYKLVGFFLTALFLSTTLFTQSRSGFLGLALGTVIFFGLMTIHFLKKTSRRSSQMMTTGGLLVSIAIVLGIFGSPFSPKISDFFAKPEATVQADIPTHTVDRLEAGGTDSGEIRRIVWEGAINVWKRYPLFGSGVETFAYSYYKDRPLAHNMVSEWDFLYNKAHNELLNFLATTGIFGLGTYLLFQAVVSWFLLRQAVLSENEDEKILSAAILSGLMALHVSNFFGFSTVTVTILMYLLPGLIISQIADGKQIHWQLFAFSKASTKEGKDAKKSWLSEFFSQKLFKPKSNEYFEGVSPWQWFSISVVSMAGIFLLLRTFSIWLADHNYAQSKEAYKNSDLNTALNKIKVAIELSPQEALYFDLYSRIAGQYALAAVEQNEPELGNNLAESAIQASNTSLILNPVHLNFYKSRNQLLVTLAQVQPEFYDSALQTLRAAEELSPTDAKLPYFEGVILQAQDKKDEAVEKLKKSIEMKPNYEAARFLLAQILETKQDNAGAKEQYQYILEKISPNNEQVKTRMEAIATLEAKKK